MANTKTQKISDERLMFRQMDRMNERIMQLEREIKNKDALISTLRDNNLRLAAEVDVLNKLHALTFYTDDHAVTSDELYGVVREWRAKAAMLDRIEAAMRKHILTISGAGKKLMYVYLGYSIYEYDREIGHGSLTFTEAISMLLANLQSKIGEVQS